MSRGVAVDSICRMHRGRSAGLAGARGRRDRVRAKSTKNCVKRRISTFFTKPLDKRCPRFSTKFSHFSSKGEAAFHSDFLKIILEKALIYKVLHTFHRLFHKNASFSWFDAVENSSFPHAEIVEKGNMAKVTKIDEKGDYFDRKRRILRRFSTRKGRCAAGHLGIFVTLFSFSTLKNSRTPFTNGAQSRII